MRKLKRRRVARQREEPRSARGAGRQRNLLRGIARNDLSVDRFADVLRNAVDVVDRLAKRRYAVVFPYISLAGVVRGNRQIGVAIELRQKPAKIPRPTVNVLFRIKRI